MRSRFVSTSLLFLRPLSQPLGSSAFIPSLPPLGTTIPDSSLLHRTCFSGLLWNPRLWQPSRAFTSDEGKGGGSRDDGDGNGSWRFSSDDDRDVAGLFGKPGEDAAGSLSGIDGDVGGPRPGAVKGMGDSWLGEAPNVKGDIFQAIDGERQSKSRGALSDHDDEWKTAEGYKPWGFDEDEGKGEAFAFGEEHGEIDGIGGGDETETEKVKAEQLRQLEKEEQELLSTLKGPNRAFGDLISASGVTEEMIDSLILLKDLRGVQGLPSLREIEDMKLAKDDAPSARFEMERKKQEEVAKARVRQVDEKGRAYGTGRRKCSSARVWIEPGEGKFIVNDKQFDIYFPIIDHRADLLRPFTSTKTLGLFDVNCTVKGGGISGQVGAIRLGISRALQNFEPGLRENLRSAGFLTRDPRAVERKSQAKLRQGRVFNGSSDDLRTGAASLSSCRGPRPLPLPAHLLLARWVVALLSLYNVTVKSFAFINNPSG